MKEARTAAAMNHLTAPFTVHLTIVLSPGRALPFGVWGQGFTGLFELLCLISNLFQLTKTGQHEQKA